MSWSEIVNKVSDFFNKPLPIVGISLAVLLVFAWKIFMSTSYGKKKYNEMKLKVEKAEYFAEQVKVVCIDEVENCKKDCDAKVLALETYYETKLAQKQAKEDNLESLVLSALGEVHNEKVKTLLIAYKQQSEETQTIMTDKINEVKREYAKEFEDRIKALEEKIYGKEAEDNKTEKEIL